MTSVKSVLKKRLTNIGVYRDAFPIARYYFDIHLDTDGITGYYMWRRNLWRVPIIHPLKERMIRRSRNSKDREQEVQKDDRSFFFSFDSIQGVVNDSNHKEVVILTSEEEILFLFQKTGDYETFMDHIKSGAGEKVFSRDGVEIPASVYIS